jgi:glutaredoxin
MAHFAKFILLIVSIWSPFFCFAQDGLILYTKTGCSNCAYAKTALQNNNIKFREYNVDVASNAQKMLKLLVFPDPLSPIIKLVLPFSN